jgi:hypothetical protein
MARTVRTIGAVAIVEQRILLTQAGPGMVLSQPVIMPNRMVLCPRETVLTDALIHQLMARGIKRIHIRGTPIPGGHQIGYTERRGKLANAFSRVRSFDHMAAIERVIEQMINRRP